MNHEILPGGLNHFHFPDNDSLDAPAVVSKCLGRSGQAPEANISEPSTGSGGAGLRAMLCTDGIHSVLDERVIEQALVERSGLDCVDHLVETAIRRGSRDNYSLIIVEVDE